MDQTTLMRELNPEYDLSRHIYDDSIIGDFKDLGVLVLNMSKSFVRGASAGAVAGTVAGAVYGVVSGDIPKGTLEGLRAGAAFGASLDILQYSIHYVADKLKKDISKF